MHLARRHTRADVFSPGGGVFFDRSVVVGITLCHPVSKKRLRLLEVFFWKKKKMNSRTDDCTCWLMWYFMSMVIFNRLTILFRITSYVSWLRNGNKLFVTGAQICWIYNRELSLKLRFLGMGVYIRHRRGNSNCAEILTPPQDGGERGWGGWGLSKVKFSRSPLITFDDFRGHPRPPPPPPPPPPMSSLSKQIWVSPFWTLPKFSAIPP